MVSAPPGPYRHWISVDCRYLPHREHIKEGVLSIYTNEDDCVTGLALFSAQATLPDEGADFLYAHRAVSLPPPDASPELDKDTYLDHWQDNCPIYHSTDVVAVLGGWHFPWPDGDWEALRERRLLVWTLADSEPWVEAWEWQGETTVMQRIT